MTRRNSPLLQRTPYRPLPRCDQSSAAAWLDRLGPAGGPLGFETAGPQAPPPGYALRPNMASSLVWASASGATSARGPIAPAPR